MKKFVMLLIVASVMVLSKAATQEEQMQAMQKIIMDCAAKENASQEDIQTFLDHKPAVSPTAKCHRACLHENFGTMKDNKFNGEAFIGMMTMKYGGDDAKMKSAQEVVSACSSVQDADRCEAGAKICKCLAENTMSRGL